MGKILIDSEELENLLQDVQVITYTDVMGKRTNDIFETLDKAFNLIDQAKKFTNFSVVEWRPVSEIPTHESVGLIRFKNGTVKVCEIYASENGACFKDYLRDTVSKWAYLPE